MRNGTCPKCGAQEVYCATRNRGAYGVNTIPTGFFRTFINMDNYVCGQCGHVEFYISDPKGLQKIKNKWSKVRLEAQNRTTGC